MISLLFIVVVNIVNYEQLNKAQYIMLGITLLTLNILMSMEVIALALFHMSLDKKFSIADYPIIHMSAYVDMFGLLFYSIAAIAEKK